MPFNVPGLWMMLSINLPRPPILLEAVAVLGTAPILGVTIIGSGKARTARAVRVGAKMVGRVKALPILGTPALPLRTPLDGIRGGGPAVKIPRRRLISLLRLPREPLRKMSPLRRLINLLRLLREPPRRMNPPRRLISLR